MDPMFRRLSLPSLLLLATSTLTAPVTALAELDVARTGDTLSGPTVVASSTAVQSTPLNSKSQYHLLNPTPRDRMRPISTDRPDKTESPYTVDAGHFQIEMDLLQYTRDREDGVRLERWHVAPMNLKVGLLNNVDLQLLLETYVDELTVDRDEDIREHKRGFGDVTARIKINLWGNDGGSTAFAVMPFIKFPTNQDRLGNNAVEGGMRKPRCSRAKLPGAMGTSGVSILGNLWRLSFPKPR
jgi:hypothetical protein